MARKVVAPPSKEPVSDEVRAFLRAIGKKGGSKMSSRKRAAILENAAKGREARWAKHRQAVRQKELKAWEESQR